MRISGMTLFLLIGCLCYVTANNFECTKKSCSGINQEYRPCGTYWYCEPTCERPGGRPCPRICVAGCFCREDYIRERINGTCIRKQECGQ